MKLRTSIKAYKSKKLEIQPSDPLIFLGSCFAENIGNRCLSSQLKTFINPLGISYNPISLFSCITNTLNNTNINSLHFVTQETAHAAFHYDYHSTLKGNSKEDLEKRITSSQKIMQNALRKARVLFISLGSCFAYRYKKTGQIIANCHKQPSDVFEKHGLSIHEISEAFECCKKVLTAHNPELDIVFTVSPVRHTKEGIVQNTLSKARLIEFAHAQTQKESNIHYFESYELMIDDLRDYRFYKDDLIHPSAMAIDYIWSHFMTRYFDKSTQEYVNEAEKISTFLTHKILSQNQKEIEAFEQKKKQLISDFEKKHKITWRLQ